jgi:hypothetical protein
MATIFAVLATAAVAVWVVNLATGTDLDDE